MLDTNIVSAAIKTAPEVSRHLSALAPQAWCISAVTRSELRYGLARRPLASALAERVNRFLAMAHCVPWGEAAADAHGNLRAYFDGEATRIGDFDEMIAAHALSLGAVLVTDNTKHFSRVPQLRIENWLR